MDNLKSPIEKELKALIKEALLNGDTHMLESFLESHDKEMLQEIVWFAAIPAILKGLGAAATVGGTVWASDALGVTDNWYDKGVKYVDPTHYVTSAFSGKNNPMFGRSPNKLKSGWLSKGVSNLFQGKDFSEGWDVEEDTKTEFRKKLEAGGDDITAREIAQELFDAMDGAGSGVGTVKGILQLNPDAKPGSPEELQMALLWTEIHKEFDNVTAAEDDGDKDKDLVWWLEDEGDFPEEAKKMKEFLDIIAQSPEELEKRYMNAMDDPDAPEGAISSDDVGSAEGAEGVAAPKKSAMAGVPDAEETGGLALLGLGAQSLESKGDAANTMWSAYNTLKNKGAEERSEEENELLSILGQAAAS